MMEVESTISINKFKTIQITRNRSIRLGVMGRECFFGLGILFSKTQLTSSRVMGEDQVKMMFIDLWFGPVLFVIKYKRVIPNDN